jgi:nitroreductase
MELPFEKWYPAIFKRRSRRNFSSRLPEREKIDQLERVCREFRPFGEARVEFVQSPPEGIFKGIVGRYGKVTGAPFYLAFIGRLSSPRVQEIAGYVGEAAVLEATALGLDTCWVGGFFKPEIVRQRLSLEEEEKVLSVSPLGYAREPLNLTERTFRGIAGSAKRKSLKELIVQGNPDSSWMKKALESARLAPSAANRQPWRFSLTEDSILVSTDTKRDVSMISKRLDCGIAMLHLELGALEAGVKGRWEFLESPDVAQFTAK